MTEFVLCEHPDLPGQQVLMASPRNGWTPVADEDPETPSGGSDGDPDAGKPNTPPASPSGSQS